MDLIPKDWVYDAETGGIRHPNTSPDEIRKAYETGERVQIAHALTKFKHRIDAASTLPVTDRIDVYKQLHRELTNFIYTGQIKNSDAADKMCSNLQYRIEADQFVERKKVNLATKNKSKIQPKATIRKLDEFKEWDVRYSDGQITIKFKDNRTPVKLFPEDFGEKTWNRLLIILVGGEDDKITPYQRQDVNNRLKTLFKTRITFFPKNKPIPDFIKLQRSKIDRGREAEREYTEYSAGVYNENDFDF